MALPITVILPTRNAAAGIDAHLEAMEAWLPDAAQVVVVDSSEDDTLARVRARLGGRVDAEFHARPRGLYEAWNFGVSRARERCVYFSTVGDSLDADGLRFLFSGLERSAADIFVSPPRMAYEDPEAKPLKWPIHAATEHLAPEAPVVLAPELAFVLSTSFLPGTLLGSSASNLYRTEFLRARPFPEGWGHCADSAWMISHAAEARVAITARPVATFVRHAGAAGVSDGQMTDLRRRVAAISDHAALPPGVGAVLAGWFAFHDARRTTLLDRVASLDARQRDLAAKLTALHELRQRERAASRAEIDDLVGRVRAAREINRRHEQAHRSLAGIAALYGRAKAEQVKKAWNAAWKLVRR